MRQLRESLQPKTEFTIQMDYSENYSCMYQDEISAVYYDKHQITIHPMVVYYIDESGNQQHFSRVGVTKEKSHTIATTLAFLKEIQPKLKEKLPDLQTVHYITDSPSSQYRNKSAAALLANHHIMFGTTSTWHWLEAGHGKGPCDGIGGSVKKMAETGHQ